MERELLSLDDIWARQHEAIRQALAKLALWEAMSRRSITDNKEEQLRLPKEDPCD